MAWDAAITTSDVVCPGATPQKNLCRRKKKKNTRIPTENALHQTRKAEPGGPGTAGEYAHSTQPLPPNFFAWSHVPAGMPQRIFSMGIAAKVTSWIVGFPAPSTQYCAYVSHSAGRVPAAPYICGTK